MSRYVSILGLVLVASFTTPASAQQNKLGDERPVLIAPIQVIGSQYSAKKAREIRAKLANAVDSIDGIRVVSSSPLRTRIRAANKPRLHTCEGTPICLAELGALMNAEGVIYMELGGLGSLHVAYLKLVDVRSKREVRSTTLEMHKGAVSPQATRAAAYRLVALRRYTGQLHIATDVHGASIFVDGKRIAKSPTPPITLAVGTHALRVTHPEFRDFVQFVDIQFDQPTSVKVGLQQYPIIATELQKTPVLVRPRPHKKAKTPWYKRWYTIAGASTIAVIGTAVVVGILSDGIDFNEEVTLNDP